MEQLDPVKEVSLNLSAGEFKLCRILWDAGAVSSSKVMRLCQEQYGWKKSTTFTFLRRLVEKQTVTRHKGTVTILVSKETVQCYRVEKMVQETFNGSASALCDIVKDMCRDKNS